MEIVCGRLHYQVAMYQTYVHQVAEKSFFIITAEYICSNELCIHHAVNSLGIIATWMNICYTWTEIDDNRIKALIDYRRAELYNSSSRSCITYRILRRLEHLVTADEELDLPLKCTCCDGLSLMIDRRINKLLLPALCSNNECKIGISIKVNNFKWIKLFTLVLIFYFWNYGRLVWILLILATEDVWLSVTYQNTKWYI